MSKRTYIIIAVLLFFLAGYVTGPVFNAMRRFVFADHDATMVVLNPTGGVVIYFRFLLPFGLAFAAIPIAFMIIQNRSHAAMILILSLVGASIALLFIRYYLQSAIAWNASLGLNVLYSADKHHLEIVPWVSFAITVLGTVVLELRGKKGSQQDDPADPDVHRDR